VHTSVLVDAWHLGGYSANRGIGTYLRNVLPRLVADHGLRVDALATASTALPTGVGRRTIRRVAPDRFAQREHDLLLPLSLRLATLRRRADVVFSPADNPPARSPRPWVQMLHDLIPLVVDAPAFAAGDRRWRHLGPRLRNATAVLTNSRCTASDAVRRLGLEADRVHVAPLGVSPSFAPPPERLPTDPPTVLYVGEYGPHKGFDEAFAVIEALADAGLPHRLAMVGFLAPWHEASVHALLQASGRRDRIDLVGFVDDIVAAYQRADVLIVTSRYEGFCLPVLEAMACGTPVVAFSNSALPEVVGDAGILVPDGDVGAMVEELRDLLGGESRWQELSERGLEQAGRFTWERCADVHADVLQGAASST
jgi:glycosyltransferase involved in cell wall biosynthesis